MRGGRLREVVAKGGSTVLYIWKLFQSLFVDESAEIDKQPAETFNVIQ